MKFFNIPATAEFNESFKTSRICELNNFTIWRFWDS